MASLFRGTTAKSIHHARPGEAANLMAALELEHDRDHDQDLDRTGTLLAPGMPRGPIDARPGKRLY